MVPQNKWHWRARFLYVILSAAYAAYRKQIRLVILVLASIFVCVALLVIGALVMKTQTTDPMPQPVPPKLAKL